MATLFSDTLDKVMVQELTTGWTELNASQVKYNGGNEVKIPDIAMQKLANYDRAEGFKRGAVTLKWETYRFRYDRGREFIIDAMDVDETNFQVTAANVMGEFARVEVVPEVDLIRLSEMALKADTKFKSVATTPTAKFAEFKAGITAIRAAGYAGQLVAHVTYGLLSDLQLAFQNQLQAVTFAVGGVDTTFQSIDGVALIPTPDARMFTNVDVNVTTELITGTGAEIKFLIAGTTIPIGVTKHNPIRIFTPETNQDMDAWKLQYRLYHDLWVLANKQPAIYLGYKGDIVGFKQPLIDMIAGIEYVVTGANAGVVDAGVPFTTTAVKGTLEAAVVVAQEVVDNAAATGAEVDPALVTLQAAIDVYTNAIKVGTKTE